MEAAAHRVHVVLVVGVDLGLVAAVDPELALVVLEAELACRLLRRLDRVDVLLIREVEAVRINREVGRVMDGVGVRLGDVRAHLAVALRHVRRPLLTGVVAVVERAAHAGGGGGGGVPLAHRLDVRLVRRLRPPPQFRQREPGAVDRRVLHVARLLAEDVGGQPRARHQQRVPAEAERAEEAVGAVGANLELELRVALEQRQPLQPAAERAAAVARHPRAAVVEGGVDGLD